MIENVDEIKTKANFKQVLISLGRSDAELHPTSEGFRTNCLIHPEDKGRCLCINTTSGLCCCHHAGCSFHRGGDIIQLYMQAKGIEFDVATIDVANISSVPFNI